MDGSSSIGGLSRASGDEQLMKSQRVGDKKGKEGDNRKKEKRQRDSDKQTQEFEAVIVDVALSSGASSQESLTIPSEPIETQEPQASKEPIAPQGEMQVDASKDKESNSNPLGHIDVTG